MVSAAPVSPFTRGYVANGMYDNFKVFVASEKDGAQTVAMDGYEVKFVTDDWSYVYDTQHLVYWNPNADSYLFTAGAPHRCSYTYQCQFDDIKYEEQHDGQRDGCRTAEDNEWL